MKTIFCDIDGTLLKHKGDILLHIKEEPELLDNVIETIKNWDKKCYKIILTTGRKESLRKLTEEQLLKVGIIYDQLIMGISNGDRILINDRKQNTNRDTAYAINVNRNEGFKDLDI